MHNIINRDAQSGATLLIGLIMLVILSVITATAIRMSNVNLKIVGNAQAKAELTAAAQRGIDTVLSAQSNFYTPVNRTLNLDVDGDTTPDYTVTVTAPACVQSTLAEGYSVDFAAAAPKFTFWEISATATDARTGATAKITQGVKVLLSSGVSC